MFYARLWAGFVGVTLLALGIWAGTATDLSIPALLNTGGQWLTVTLPIMGTMSLYAVEYD